MFQIFIGSDTLKFSICKEAKYLGITFNDSKCDNSDMLRQMRLLYAKSNKLLRTFIHYSSDVKVIQFQSYCPFISGTIIKKYIRR